MNLENAMRGARNPLNSWAKSDSYYDENGQYILGENDLGLAKRLARAGSDHRKYLRQVFVSVDVTAPMYWWKEYDTYKIATVGNSCSTMHKIHAKKFEMSDFSVEHLRSLGVMHVVIDELNFYRDKFNKDKKKEDWWEMIQLLPTSYNQKRTVHLNYEVLGTIYHQRRHHKLDEWVEFCNMIKTLPYSEFITREFE